MPRQEGIVSRHSPATSILARLAAAALTACGFALASTAGAHHAFSVFDMQAEIVIEGEVVEFEWINPHTWTWINVTNEDGSVTKWGLEGMSPNYLGRRGWNRNSLGPGDKIAVTVNPLKSGEPGGTFLRCTLEDGTVKVMFGR
jgi:hypothetical protein